MKIELSYQYSELDKNHQFGLVLEDEYYQPYFRWVYFYLGKYLSDNVRLYPFNVGKVLKNYKWCNDAEKQAKLIANKIN